MIQNLFCGLHVSLRQEIQYKLSRDFLHQIPCLAALPRNILEYLSLFVEENIYLPGDYIFSRGELNDHIIYVLSGQAVIVGGTRSGKKWRRRMSENQVAERK